MLKITFDFDFKRRLLPAPLSVTFAPRVRFVESPVDSSETLPTDVIGLLTVRASADSIDTPPDPAET